MAIDMTGKEAHGLKQPNFFVYIYTSHAHATIKEYIEKNRRKKIRRAKIETDIIRITHESPDLPTLHKLACSSMIMHTDTFEPFWSEQQLAHNLSARSVQRLEPQYSLIEGIPCPREDSPALSSGEAPITKWNNQARGAKKKTQPPKPDAKNERTKKGTTFDTSTTIPAATNPPSATAARGMGRGGKRQTQSRVKVQDNVTVNPLTEIPNRGGKIGSILVTPEKEGSTMVKTVSECRRPLSAREAYEACMARKEDDFHLRGPSSDEENTSDDDDSNIE